LRGGQLLPRLRLHCAGEGLKLGACRRRVSKGKSSANSIELYDKAVLDAVLHAGQPVDFDDEIGPCSAGLLTLTVKLQLAA
jgi:hypothetical protein